MYRTHKIALNANKQQREWFAQQCGYARFAFNHALSNFRANLDNDNFLSTWTLNNQFNKSKKDIEWTQAQDQRAALYGIMNLGNAIKNWVDKRSRFPKYKKRGSRQSWTTDEQAVRVEGKRVKLPKIGWVKMFEELRFDGPIIKITISRTAHRWVVSITVETEDTEAVDNSTHPVIGIDVGINTLATLDNGKKYDNPRPLKCYERKLKRANRRLSKKKFLSNNWYKAKERLARLHYRIACIRQDAHHKATTDIVNNASVICIETLKITNMLRNNRKVAKALSDSALGGFLTKLKCKAETLGIPVIEAPQFFASSKTCSSCGHKKTELSLAERKPYNCDVCQYTEDRDVNAAKNLKQLAAGYAESINACGV